MCVCTYLPFARHLDAVSGVRPQRQLHKRRRREQIADQTAAGHLPCDQAVAQLQRRHRLHRLPGNIGGDQRAIAHHRDDGQPPGVGRRHRITDNGVAVDAVVPALLERGVEGKRRVVNVRASVCPCVVN